MEEKKKIRKEILAKRDTMSKDEILEKSHLIMERVVSHYDFLKAEAILCFINYKSEVITKGIIEYAFMLGKKVFCPVIIHKSSKESPGEMDFYEISSLSECVKNEFGILEPKPIEEHIFKQNDAFVSLMILPGAAFDESGNRIGYGAGYYDSYLRKEFEGVKLGIGFDFQLLPKIPVNQLDEKVGLIITEERMLCLDEK